MEIRLNGKEAGIIMACMAVEAVIGFVALDKWKKAAERADRETLKAVAYDADRFVKGIEIKRLRKEIARLKSERKGKES